MRILRRHFPLALLFLFACALAVPVSCVAQDLSGAARSLGRQIVVSVGKEKRLVLKYHNLSSLSPALVEQARAALEAGLQSQSMRLTAEPYMDALVQVTFSENVESYLLVAEILRPESSEVAMVETPRIAAVPATSAETLPLEKTLLLEQPEQILDVAVMFGEDARPSAMLVLEPSRIALYTQEASRWQFRQAQSIPRDWPWPRDLRGRILAEPSGFRAYLPGVVCNGTIAPGLTLECRAAADAWPVTAGARRLGAAEFSARRNFFTGKVSLASGENFEFPPFYSFAPVAEQGAWLWVMSGVDGRVRLQKGSAPPEPLPVVWGSDIAGIQSDCSGGSLVLATQAAAENGGTTATAYRSAGGQFVPGTRPALLPGNVTALWSAANGNSAVIVLKNREIGNYEAYSLAIACKR